VFQLIPGYSSLCPWGGGVSNGEFYTALRQDTRRTIILSPRDEHTCWDSRNLGSAGRIPNRKSKIANRKFLSSGYCRLLTPPAAYFLKFITNWERMEHARPRLFRRVHGSNLNHELQLSYLTLFQVISGYLTFLEKKLFSSGQKATVARGKRLVSPIKAAKAKKNV